jgi:hypothetical protein
MNLSLEMMLFLLVVGHALADYPLQGDFLANGKNRNTAIGAIFWPHALFAHSVIHGGFVAIITGSVFLGILETAIHAVTDWLKCENKISLRTDQAIHFACKVAWAVLATYGLA